MHTYRYILIALLAVCLSAVGQVAPSSHAYFEFKFRCQIGGSSIGITLNDGELCFDYLAKLNIKINAVQQDIGNAEFLIENGEDVEFWRGVLTGLKGEEKTLLDQQFIVIASMKDFEAALFLQVKTLLQRPISAEKQQRMSRIHIMRETMESTKKQGLTDSYELIVAKMEIVQYELFVMDRMLSSADFEEMVPFIKEYLSRKKN